MGLHERMEICEPLLVFGEPLAYLIDQHRSLDVAERKEFDEQLFLHRGIRRRFPDPVVERFSSVIGNRVDDSIRPLDLFDGFSAHQRSEEHTSELQSLMRNTY